MTYKKFNILMVIIGIALIVVLLNIIHLYKRNEESKINFNLSDIINNTYTSDNNTFKIDNKYITFVVDDETIIDNKKYSFNNRTGEFIIDDDISIYLRSVGTNEIIIWYNYKDYNLKEELINK